MILNINDLRERLNVLEKAYSPKTTIPALQFLKFENGKMTVSNGDTTIITRMSIEEENENEKIKCLIPFKAFDDIAFKVSNDISLQETNNQVVIKSGKSRFKLNKGDFESYPVFSMENVENTLKINSNEFKAMIKATAFSCSTSEKKPILTGVNFKFNETNVNVVATDSFRLSKYSKETNENLGNANFTIQAKDLNNLIKIIPNDIEITLGYNNNTLAIKYNNILYKTRLLEGIYPNVDKLTKMYYENSISVNSNEIMEAIDRVSIMTNNDKESYSVMLFEIKGNELSISSRDNQVGNAKEIIEIKNDNGFEISFACNGNYIIQAIKTYENENVKFNLDDPNKPFTITSENQNILQLVLPVRIEK